MPKTAAKLAPRVVTPIEIDVVISELKLDDPRLQMRDDLDQAHVKQFSESYSEGDAVPRVRVWATPEGVFPSDGYHRIAGAQMADLDEIPALLFEGSIEEAILDAAAANAKVGLRRDRTAERNSVWAVCDLLGHDLTTVSYAKKVGVNFRKAEEYWKAYLKEHKLPVPEKRRGLDDRWYSNAGWKRPEPQVVETMDPKDPRIPTTDDEIDEDAEEIHIRPKTPAAAPATNGKPKAETPPKPQKLPTEPVQDDGEWLEGLKRENGKKPVRELLAEKSPKKVEGYDREAIAYRHLMQSPTGRAFLLLAEEELGIKRGDRARGPFTRLIAELFRLDHPKDWNLCSKCKGTGREENGPCSVCKDQAGYTL